MWLKGEVRSPGGHPDPTATCVAKGHLGGVVLSLLQNVSVASAGKVSLVSTRQVDTIYTIQKGGLFSIGCYQLILKIIIGISCLKATDTNKCPASPIFKALLVSAGLNQPTPLSLVQIKNII
jgi:hypothetical protein